MVEQRINSEVYIKVLCEAHERGKVIYLWHCLLQKGSSRWPGQQLEQIIQTLIGISTDRDDLKKTVGYLQALDI